MAIEAMQTNHELETLRIVRPQEQPRRKRSRLVSIAILMLLLTVLGAASYVIYAKTIGRSPTVQTMMVVARTDRQSSVLLTGSGYIVTRHKYIIIGTKILGQIVEEPIEEGSTSKLVMFWRELMIGTIRRNCARLSLVETLPKPTFISFRTKPTARAT